MGKFFHNKEKLAFWLISAFASVVIFIYVYYFINFLTRKIGDVFSGGILGKDKITQFEIERAGEVIKP